MCLCFHDLINQNVISSGKDNIVFLTFKQISTALKLVQDAMKSDVLFIECLLGT